MSSARRIGILGSGQLGMLMIEPAKRLDLDLEFYDAAPSSCTEHLCRTWKHSWVDLEKLEAFAATKDVISYEFENVPLPTVEHLQTLCPVYPPVEALRIAQDRLLEKTMFRTLGISTNTFVEVNSTAELRAAQSSLGLPGVLKQRRLGYDGKGQKILRHAIDIENLNWDFAKAPALFESFVDFDFEVSQIAVRDQNGKIAFYPLAKNEHREGILRKSQNIHEKEAANITQQAKAAAKTILENLLYVGTFCIEFFVKDQKLYANEIAPRVHNSGHWTLTGAETSQFENHLRAIAGLSLGSTSVREDTTMLNVIGEHLPPDLKLPAGATYFDYGKSAREGRKLGHLNIPTKYMAEFKL